MYLQSSDTELNYGIYKYGWDPTSNTYTYKSEIEGTL